MTFPAIILLFLSPVLSLPIMLIVCKHKKNKQIYKPGHIPEFENPENEETDTYYGLNSSRLFPDREKGRVNKSAMVEEEKMKKTDGTPNSERKEGKLLSDTQPTKDK
ncbi:hypothetical protein Aduo_015266 [Ancylostoma duodenale]